MILLVLMTCDSFFAQTYNTLVPDSVIHGIIQEDLLHSHKYREERKHRKKVMAQQLLQWDGLLYRSKNDTSAKDIGNVVKSLFSAKRNDWLDTLFSNEDKGYLVKQIQDSKPVQAWQTKFRGAVL